MPTAVRKSSAKKAARLKSKWGQLTDQDVSTILSDAGKLADRLQERYGLALDDAREQATEFLQSASEAATAAYDKAVEAFDDGASRAEGAIKDNALLSLGGALLVGGVIGYLLGADHSHHSRPRSRW